MALTVSDDAGTNLQRNLSEWWSEETEYVFQRIERWAAFARGYNRLRSQRLSRGRMTMSNGQESRWTISSDNKLVIDDNSWCPQFYATKRSHRRKSRTEETKINCCGTFNYQSNSNLDSSCLETYRYDHSIYFKTIGDIKSTKNRQTNEAEDSVSISSEEMVEWEAESLDDYVAELSKQNDSMNGHRSPDVELENSNQNEFQPVWPIVDMAHLSLNSPDSSSEMYPNIHGNEREPTSLSTSQLLSQSTSQPYGADNNNYIASIQTPTTTIMTMTALDNDNDNDNNNNSTNNNGKETENDKNPEGIKRFLSFRRTRRLAKSVKQPPVLGENNVVWPGVLLNYVKNVNELTSSPRHCQVNVK